MFNQSTKFWIDYINQSEINYYPRAIGKKDQLFKNIYSSFNLFSNYDQTSSCNLPHQNGLRKNHGPIYTFCFNQGIKLIYFMFHL